MASLTETVVFVLRFRYNVSSYQR